MKWLPKEKRNPFIIVVLITATVLALICFGLIHSQNTTLSQVADSRKTAGNKLQDIERTIKNADLTAHELDDVTYSLTRAEEDMATGDYYSWTYNTMSLFKKQYKVEIPEIGHPAVGDVDLLPDFPYKQIRFSINGTAYFHDLGKFVADFENAFPHARMINLVIEPAGPDGEKLSFRMDIIALVKPNAL
jgi:Tfp pilus assembly protein PilO